MQVVTHNHLTI